MSDYDIHIRLLETSFTYTVTVSGRVVESGTIDADEEVAPGYYGGSEAVD